MFATPLISRPLGALGGLLTAVALIAAACSGSDGTDGPTFPDVLTLGEGEVFPVITNRGLAVGENRLSLGLIDKESSPVLDAEVRLRFFDLNGEKPQLKAEADPKFVPVELFFIDESSGKQKRIVGNNAVYAANVSFDTAGAWGMEVSVTLDGRELDPIPFRFDVLEETEEVGIGEPAPPSSQLTLADVEDVSEIDSSFPPRTQMHDITVAEALATGRPLLVAFATPAFCESRTCGPVMETVMDPLFQEYGEEATFIHIEPFRLPELRSGSGRIPVEATEEWGLRTEPWMFVVDGDGNVAAKFEGIVGLDEVEGALLAVLAEAGA